MKTFTVSVFALLFFSVGFAIAENVALGKKAIFYPIPNYRECTDPEDAVQLTDGKLTPDSGQFWSLKSTVGWKFYHPRIFFDLGQIEPIESVAVRSVGGGVSGVYFPREIVVYVSDDNETFREVGRMTSANLRQDGKKAYTHSFSVEGLKTRGRYVMIGLKPTGHLVYTDEIEINRGDFDPMKVVFSGPAINGEKIRYGAFGLKPETYTRGHIPEAPRVDWAIPLAGKPVRAILMNDSRFMRDVAGIAQRLGVEYTPVPFNNPLEDLSKQLLAANLPNCDVLVTGAINWKAMPQDLLTKIRDRIREGMGLVCVEANPSEQIPGLFTENRLSGDQGILDLVPVTRIPGYHAPVGGSHFKLAAYGKGRVALLSSAAFTRPARFLLPTFTHEDYIEKTNGPLEYWFAAFNKLTLWAAGRDERQIAKIEASPEKIAVEVNPGTKAEKLRVTVRDPFFSPAATWEETVSAKGGRFEFPPPQDLQGTHAVDVWLLDGKDAVWDFGSTFYQHDGEHHIVSFQKAKPVFTPGEPIEAVVKVQKPSEGLTLRASLFDTEGREVSAARTLPVSADGKIEVSLPYPNPLTLGATLGIELLQDGKTLEKQRKRIWVELPERQDFTVLGWSAPNEMQPFAASCAETLRKLGVDQIVGLYQPNRAENAALENLRFAPEDVARVAPPNPPATDGIRVPSLSAPSHRKQVEEKLKALAKDSRRFGVTEWSLGDEESLGNPGDEYDFSPDSLAEFREWLKGQYTDLRELNESWESDFKDWTKVTPSTLKQVKPEGSLASWLDFRRFMESVFADYHARASKIIKVKNPSARVGLSGTQNPNSYNGYDWWKLMKAVDHLSGYGGAQSALQRSFLRPGAFFTTFIGYDYGDSEEQAARGAPWQVLFGGANGVNYYELLMTGVRCGLLQNDLSPTQKAAWFFPEIQELKAGTGRLFMEAQYEDDGIGILYSPSSVHAATATGLADPGNKQRNFGVNLTNLVKLLSESHYQCRFVHEEQLRQGELSRFKVLFLPWNSSVSDAEAAAIRKFVKDGGTVIADSFAGVRDGHGKPRAMLEDVFGVRQPLKAPALEDGTLEVTDDTFSGPHKIPVTTGLTRVELKGGEARGSVGRSPAFIIHAYGKGRAIFLNASFSNYAKQVSGGEGGELEESGETPQSVTAPIRAFVTALLTEAGVPVPLRARSGEVENSEIELSRFRLGDARLLGALRKIKGGPIDPDDRADVTLTLDQPWHVYDIRAGKYLGETEIIRESLPRATAKAYALLPYKVNSTTVSSHSQLTPGEAATFKVTVSAEGKLGKHVVHLSVLDPDGNERAAYAQNLIASNGEVGAVIPFAWNDPEGEWTIMAKDVATGVIGKAVVQLKK